MLGNNYDFEQISKDLRRKAIKMYGLSVLMNIITIALVVLGYLYFNPLFYLTAIYNVISQLFQIFKGQQTNATGLLIAVLISIGGIIVNKSDWMWIFTFWFNMELLITSAMTIIFQAVLLMQTLTELKGK